MGENNALKRGSGKKVISNNIRKEMNWGKLKCSAN